MVKTTSDEQQSKKPRLTAPQQANDLQTQLTAALRRDCERGGMEEADLKRLIDGLAGQGQMLPNGEELAQMKECSTAETKVEYEKKMTQRQGPKQKELFRTPGCHDQYTKAKDPSLLVQLTWGRENDSVEN
jgi:hypothetical protein